MPPHEGPSITEKLEQGKKWRLLTFMSVFRLTVLLSLPIKNHLDGKAILHSIQDDRLELAASVGEKRFREAFTLGARLAIEIFTMELGNQYSDNTE